MSREDDFRIRPGRIRSRGVQRAKPFVAQALAAAQKAGGQVSRSGRIGAPRASRFGRGRIAERVAGSVRGVCRDQFEPGFQRMVERERLAGQLELLDQRRQYVARRRRSWTPLRGSTVAGRGRKAGLLPKRHAYDAGLVHPRSADPRL